MWIKEYGSVIFLREMHWENELLPKNETDDGIDISVKCLLLAKWTSIFGSDNKKSIISILFLHPAKFIGE